MPNFSEIEPYAAELFQGEFVAPTSGSWVDRSEPSLENSEALPSQMCFRRCSVSQSERFRDDCGRNRSHISDS